MTYVYIGVYIDAYIFAVDAIHAYICLYYVVCVVYVCLVVLYIAVDVYMYSYTQLYLPIYVLAIYIAMVRWGCIYIYIFSSVIYYIA